MTGYSSRYPSSDAPNKVPKHEESAMLAAQIETFLAKGGTIQKFGNTASVTLLPNVVQGGFQPSSHDDIGKRSRKRGSKAGGADAKARAKPKVRPMSETHLSW